MEVGELLFEKSGLHHTLACVGNTYFM